MVHFKIKRNTQLKKLMQAYCDRQGFQMSTIRFMFDGNPLGPEATPSEVSQYLWGCTCGNFSKIIIVL